MRAVFVAGAHTDVGKTHVACALIRAARARGLSVDAFKPLVSGFDPAQAEASDPGRLLAALGRAPDEASLAAMSPWRFRAPLAPPMAARLEGVKLELAAVVAACRARIASAGVGLLVIEGVGGVMSPVTEDATGLDLMAALGLPALLVGGGYLGAISHALTGIEAIRTRNIEIAAVVVSQAAEAEAPDFGETAAAVARFAGRPVIAAPRATDSWAGAALQAALGA